MRSHFQILACKIALLLTCISPFGVHASTDELVILTTFSREPLIPLVEQFSKEHKNAKIKVIHRPTTSSMTLLSKSYVEDIDLVLTSSPLVISSVAKQGKLANVPDEMRAPEVLKPYILPSSDSVVTIGYSGAGVVWNSDYLNNHQLPQPQGFLSLADPAYFGHVTMSTPSRSGTTQLMIESTLEHYGWNKGWTVINNIGANLGTLSSRSFGVSDAIASGSLGLGPTIDSYAKILMRKLDYVGFVHDTRLTLMPTYIGLVKRESQDAYLTSFVERLLSPNVQASIQENAFAKYSVLNTELLSNDHVQLNLDTISSREEGVKLLFDITVTKQLPALQDAWLRVISAREKYYLDTTALHELDSIESLLFAPPVSLEMFNQQMDNIFNTGKSNAEISALLAQWQHNIRVIREDTLEIVADRIRMLSGGLK
ncbi:putative ABC-type Fe3+ transport system,periplasmic component [Vibrio nigripulchritudo SOn1]|uniref:ABC-type Fe3+ transport system,periplasmic component n=1 Tax=Vibrio nigripulchritudo SOn1 TaxID=1238450 RepID=A0AAV2VMA6_9VIBR|nr:ABC transporter substrate-binding protein [Vibrio nigripulchritudo]CCO45765.1 putative ABC-type Fe3+ transport system,periplasmic component [Vibrio nigripulchritudo SOn1]